MVFILARSFTHELLSMYSTPNRKGKEAEKKGAEKKGADKKGADKKGADKKGEKKAAK